MTKDLGEKGLYASDLFLSGSEGSEKDPVGGDSSAFLPQRGLGPLTLPGGWGAWSDSPSEDTATCRGGLGPISEKQGRGEGRGQHPRLGPWSWAEAGARESLS